MNQPEAYTGTIAFQLGEEMIFYIILIVLLGLDQITKALIHSKFLEGDTFPIIRDFFHLTYVQNRGVAFGILQNKAIFINFISIGAVLSMIWYLHLNYKKISKSINNSILLLIKFICYKTRLFKIRQNVAALAIPNYQS